MKECKKRIGVRQKDMPEDQESGLNLTNKPEHEDCNSKFINEG